MKKTFILTALFLLSACGDRALVSKSELQDLRNAQNELKEELNAEKNKPAPVQSPASTQAKTESPSICKIDSITVEIKRVKKPDQSSERVVTYLMGDKLSPWTIMERLEKLIENSPAYIAYEITERRFPSDLHLSVGFPGFINKYVHTACGPEAAFVATEELDTNEDGDSYAKYGCFKMCSTVEH